MKIRGFLEEPIELKMLMLTEEIGEVAKAIRKDKVNMGIDKNNINNYGTIESELVDVFIVLISICNVLNINLFTAIKNKEEKNINRTWQVNKLEEDITI